MSFTKPAALNLCVTCCYTKEHENQRDLPVKRPREPSIDGVFPPKIVHKRVLFYHSIARYNFFSQLYVTATAPPFARVRRVIINMLSLLLLSINGPLICWRSGGSLTFAQVGEDEQGTRLPCDHIIISGQKK